MPEWLFPAICGLFIAFALYKAFWKPPPRDPDKEPWSNPDWMP